MSLLLLPTSVAKPNETPERAAFQQAMYNGVTHAKVKSGSGATGRCSVNKKWKKVEHYVCVTEKVCGEAVEPARG